MKDIYYFAAYTDSGCLLGCDHHHRTVCSAAACISSPGGYVIAVENGSYRQLNDAEEREFKAAMYGSCESDEKEASFVEFTLRVRIKLRPLDS